MNENNLVSVIVPIYNSEKSLHRCIKSIINQSYKNIEIIFIDDGSTDNSGEICDSYKDKRIKVIHTKNNGVSIARNKGIKNSKGEFIFFVDSDDFIENNALTLLIENYKKHRADIIMGDFKIENNSKNTFLFPNNKLLTRNEIIDYVRSYLRKPTGYSLFIYVWGRLFKSSIIKDNNVYFNPDMKMFEDITFNFNYLKFVNSVYYIKNRIYTYIINISMKIYDNPLGYKLALESIKEFLKDIDEDIKKEIGNAHIFFAIRTMIRFFEIRINLKYIHKLISNMINDSDIRQNLNFYSPSKGDSKILPILIRLKLVWLIILVCKYKSGGLNGKNN